MITVLPDTHPAWGMVLNHNAMRTDVARLEKCARASQAIDRETAALLTQWFSFIARSLHHHHEAEDEDVYPLLAQRDPTFSAAVANLVDEHVKLTTLVTAVETALAALRDTATDADRGAQTKALAEHVTALNKLLLDHLAAEERELVDRMATALSEKDMTGIENKMRRRAPLKDIALILPWIYDTATPQDREVFMKRIPWVFKALLRVSWQKRYAKLTAPLSAYRGA